MLELLFRGFFEWIYGLILECWEYFSSVLFDLMSLDFAYLETYMPIITTIRQIMLGVGWALLLGNLVFQATRSMMAGVGFEADDPKLLFTRTFVFSFLRIYFRSALSFEKIFNVSRVRKTRKDGKRTVFPRRNMVFYKR